MLVPGKTVYCSYFNTLIYHRLKMPLLLVSQIAFDTRWPYMITENYRWTTLYQPPYFADGISSQVIHVRLTDISCMASLWFRNVCGYLIISMTHCDGAGSWNHSLWKTGIRLSCMANTIVTDTIAALTTQGARASSVLNYLMYRDFRKNEKLRMFIFQ